MALDLEPVLKLTEELLRISSPLGGEAEIADHVHARLKALNPHTLLRAKNSLCCVPRSPDESKPTLMLLGHLDTVPAGEENPVRREGDHLHGLGATDMKAADAVLLQVLEQSLAVESPYNLVGVLYSCEEGPFKGSEMPLIQAAAKEWFERTDLAVCMEPTDNAIELGCLGTMHATVTFTGKRAHSARPWQGENAIHKAAGLLVRLSALEREEHVYSGLTFYEVISATKVDFRGSHNVIPELCTFNVNYRFAPDKDEAGVRARLEELVSGEATFEIVDYCPAGRVCGENALLQDLKAAGEDRLQVRAKQAWTDVGRLSNLGIDALNWGPGSISQAHQTGEWVSIAEVERSLQILQRWLFAKSGG